MQYKFVCSEKRLNMEDWNLYHTWTWTGGDHCAFFTPCNPPICPLWWRLWLGQWIWLPLLLLPDQHLQSLRSNMIKGLNWFFNLKLLGECIKNISDYIKINMRVIKKWFSAHNLTPCIETLHKILKMCSAMIIIVDYYTLSIMAHYTISYYSSVVLAGRLSTVLHSNLCYILFMASSSSGPWASKHSFIDVYKLDLPI